MKAMFRFKYHLLWGVLWILACNPGSKPEFSDWYQSYQDSFSNGAEAKIHQAVFYSSPLPIDTIYRSMQGPFEIKRLSIDSEEELIWIVGYESKLQKLGGDVEQMVEPLQDKYMCHNNLNYASKEKIPWKVKTSGNNSRIFTLSEGQTELVFPEGFGIPVPSGQTFEMVSQVLNHREKNIDIQSRHRVTFSYMKDSELKNPLKPLYQQSVFVTKQIAGPAGAYGLPRLCVEHHLDSNQIKGKSPKHDCSIDIKTEDYDPYRDAEGRIYTGHWKLPYGKEVLTTDVTKMLDLNEDSRIHMIGVHLHPFAKGLELWDKSSNRLLFAPDLSDKPNHLGFKEISYYRNKKGIAVYKDHRYELKSIYNCSDSAEEHTAMAVMYLYLADE